MTTGLDDPNMQRASLSQAVQLTTPADHRRSAPWQAPELQALCATIAYRTYLVSQQSLVEAERGSDMLAQRGRPAAAIGRNADTIGASSVPTTKKAPGVSAEC
ncbi:MAG: hypothetical protein ABIR94_07055 [Rubrivivax sp.]